MEQKHYSFAVITLSDKGARGEREDTSGPNLVRILGEAGFTGCFHCMLPDNKKLLVEKLIELSDRKVSLIVTTGGTGVSPTDITPEAMDFVMEKEVPGMADMMRIESLKITPRACLSRGKVGIRRESLIVNLPGSKKAAQENIEFLLPVLPHALEKIAGDPSDCG